ncbi:MAG: indolepyruvate ferredoxin oxidoreductase subunit alpha [Proteobacteria bacterium]|nr:indolepyruvate ferredoxin oxidoreductase subunit alpha [Pseudomonadota bacterium]MBU1611056.1 indolepyruvate ferredoxin oxidoreductase subunit alpha [Pseudomonadota bacterium]
MSNPLIAGKAGETHLLLGNEAIVRGAVEAGVQFVSCYPGTPSSEVPDTFFRLSPEADYYFEYSTNEKVALEASAGAALGGARALCTMKHVGVNVAADPLMTLSYTGVPGALVLLSADDPGCHSSQNEQDNRYFARLGGLPVFEPASAQECKDMTRTAMALSDELDGPVLLRTTTRVNHLRGPVTLADAEKAPAPAGFQKDPSKYVPIPAFARPMHLRLLERMQRAMELAETSEYNTVTGSGTVGVVASGISRAYLSDALTLSGLGDKVKVLELGFTYPLPEQLVLSFMKGLTKVLVVEELEPLLENDLRVLVQTTGLDIEIFGKNTLPRYGEFTVGMVEDALRSVLGEAPAVRPVNPPEEGLPMRPPNLCAGCPHRASYLTTRKVFGDEAIYSSDIGCYTLGILPPLKSADLLVCMGSSISAGSGLSKATGQTVVAFLGDSTFFHSGMTGLANAVYNQHDILVVILDNKTTAMTGHQPHPGVEKSIMGDNESRVIIEDVVRGLGVTEIRKVNPLNQKKFTAAVEELKAKSGVRVLIAEEPCPLFARRAYGKKPQVTAYVTPEYDMSEGVMERVACPAFYQDDDCRLAVNELLCAGCMLCVQQSDNIKSKKKGDK